MASIYEVILYAILFCLAFIVLQVLRLIALPLDIGFPTLAPRQVTGSIWTATMRLADYAFIAILVLLLTLWYLYNILKRIPIIGSIVRKTTPFKELRRSGIFDLFDAIVDIFASGFSPRAFKQFGQAVGGFLLASYEFAGDVTGLGFNRGGGRAGGEPVAPATPGVGTAERNAKDDGMEGRTFTEAERAQLRDEYLACLERNTTPFDPDAGTVEGLMSKVANSSTRTRCSMEQIGTLYKVMGARRTL